MDQPMKSKEKAPAKVMTTISTGTTSAVKVGVAIMMLGAVCLAAAIATIPMKAKVAPWVCGDINNSGWRNGVDVTYLQRFLIGANSGPNPLNKGDVTGDKKINQSDVTRMVQYFKGKAKLVCNKKVTKIAVEKCGDADNNSKVNTADVTTLSKLVFDNVGKGPSPLYKGDVDGNGYINSFDVDRLNNYVSKSGTGPSCPASMKTVIVGTYCGDVNGDGKTNTADKDYMVEYFKGTKGYPAWSPIEKGNVNGDDKVDGTDVVYYVSYLAGGPALNCPGIKSLPGNSTNTNTTTNTNTSVNTNTVSNTNTATNTNTAGNTNASSNANTPPPNLVVCGNINGDSERSALDVTYFLEWSRGHNSGPKDMWVADVNGDGIVNFLDPVQLLNYFKGTASLNCVENATVATSQIKCGNANGDKDGLVSGLDVTFITNYTHSGPAPFPLWAADVNGDRVVNADDSTYLAHYLGNQQQYPLHCGDSIN